MAKAHSRATHHIQTKKSNISDVFLANDYYWLYFVAYVAMRLLQRGDWNTISNVWGSVRLIICITMFPLLMWQSCGRKSIKLVQVIFHSHHTRWWWKKVWRHLEFCGENSRTSVIFNASYEHLIIVRKWNT